MRYSECSSLYELIANDSNAYCHLTDQIRFNELCHFTINLYFFQCILEGLHNYLSQNIMIVFIWSVKDTEIFVINQVTPVIFQVLTGVKCSVK